MSRGAKKAANDVKEQPPKDSNGTGGAKKTSNHAKEQPPKDSNRTAIIILCRIERIRLTTSDSAIICLYPK